MKVRMILLVMMMHAAAWASGPLVNSGFESGDFTGWLTFGQGWRTSGGGDAFTGTLGVVNDVTTNDVDNFRGIFQNVPVTAGSTYNAGVYIRAVNIESSESWFELQWMDVGGGVIDQLQSAHVAADQPFTLMALGEVIAPAGAVTASVRGIVFMPSAPAGDTDFQIFDDFFLDDLSAVDLRIEPADQDYVRVSWSTNVSAYLLESSSNLLEAVWSATPNDAEVLDGRMVTTNAVAVPETYFRLKKP